MCFVLCVCLPYTAELKDICRRTHLTVGGTRAELIQRLQA
jgi:hypothetical protein